jgi:hypothetical protein
VGNDQAFLIYPAKVSSVFIRKRFRVPGLGFRVFSYKNQTRNLRTPNPKPYTGNL